MAIGMEGAVTAVAAAVVAAAGKLYVSHLRRIKHLERSYDAALERITAHHEQCEADKEELRKELLSVRLQVLRLAKRLTGLSESVAAITGEHKQNI